ncbi:hypothetical protein EJ04DRAFT_139131 [Polyplosphaeria fusca]|uniref:Uncharacterized protein n=1 Tax=Polyplosphaeria fusca TaxID=682080 RepID=A0A9P4R592_9PLEO|nr:hypothetical protein EJ04DRAFT_139131 [Polyplosphaeria fusca]
MDIRRPTRAPPASRRLFHTGTAPRRQNMGSQIATALRMPSEERSANNELVERDTTGNYAMAAPHNGIGKGASLAHEVDEETEQENQMIAMYGTQNEHWDTAGLMAEIKAALQSSMEKKVQSLDLDKWMFEGEGKSKG